MPWRNIEQVVWGILETRGEGDLKWIFREGLPKKVLFCGRFVGVREQSRALLCGSKDRCQGYPRSAWRPKWPESRKNSGRSQRGVGALS